MIAAPKKAKATRAKAKSAIFFRATLMLFLERTNPASKNRNPICIPATNVAAIASHNCTSMGSSLPICFFGGKGLARIFTLFSGPDTTRDGIYDRETSNFG